MKIWDMENSKEDWKEVELTNNEKVHESLVIAFCFLMCLAFFVKILFL